MFSLKTQKETPDSLAKVLAVVNQKGGVGKTTMCFNLAYGLAFKGHRVLMLDLDPQMNLSQLFGIDHVNHHIFHLLLNSVKELKMLHSPVLATELLVKKSFRKGEIHLLPSGQELSGFELTVAGINGPRQLILKTFLNQSGLKKHYDYILIDAPPTLGLLMVNILCASNEVIIPYRPDEFSRKGLTHLYEVLEQVEQMGICDVPKVVAHVPNLVEGRRKQDEKEMESFKIKLCELSSDSKPLPPIYNRAIFAKGQSLKKSIFEFSGQEYVDAQQAYLGLVEKVEGMHHV